MPQVTLCFPAPDGKEPFQQHRQDGAFQGKENGGGQHGAGNPADLKLPTAQKEPLRNQMAGAEEQTVGKAEGASLPRQKTDGLLGTGVAGQQDPHGGVEGEQGKPQRGHPHPRNLPEEQGQHPGHAPQDPGVDQVVLMGQQIPDQVAPQGRLPREPVTGQAGFPRPVEGVPVRVP